MRGEGTGSQPVEENVAAANNNNIGSPPQALFDMYVQVYYIIYYTILHVSNLDSYPTPLYQPEPDTLIELGQYI